MLRRSGPLAALAVIALAACGGREPDAAAPVADERAERGDLLVIDNARVFDGERDLGTVALVLRDGRIERIEAAGSEVLPADVERIDYSGRHIIPGLVNAHAHVGNTEGTEHGDRFYTRDIVVRDLRQFQAYGVTTLVSLGMNGAAFPQIRAEVAGMASLNCASTAGSELTIMASVRAALVSVRP